jgi:hypothetical protein
MDDPAQLNFSGPWENISTLWQYLLLQLYKTLPNLTLPDQFSIPFPSPAGGTHPCPNGGHLTPAPYPKIKLATSKYNVCTVVTCQYRVNPGQMFGDNRVIPGGHALAYWADVIVDLTKRLRKEGDTKPIYATEEIPLTKEQYLKLREKGTDRIYDRYTGFTENYVNELKQKGVPQHYQIKDTDEIIGYEYIDKNLPDVKAVEYGGQEMNVYFKNNYGQSVEIQYVSPGKKTKEGQFAVADARPEPGSYYDSAPDFEQVYVTDIDEVLGGSGKVEQYATKAKTPRYTKGAAEVDDAEGRALMEIDRLKDEGLIDD